MAKQATKACGNRYFEARMRAARYNEKLLTRAGAAEALPGVMEDSLKKYELDINRPPNTVVALMADTYGEPELRAWYCANECPLGRDCREIPTQPPERAVLRLQNSLGSIDRPLQQLAQLLDDNATQLTAEETSQLPVIREELTELKRRISETLAALERAEKLGFF